MSDDDLHELRQSDLDRTLDWIRAGAAGREEGVFGSTSAIWQVDREAAVFLGAGRALLFGSLDQALATARRLHRRHAAIRGQLPEPFARYVAGSAYYANHNRL